MKWTKNLIKSATRFSIVGIILTIWTFIYWNFMELYNINVNWKIIISIPLTWTFKFLLYHVFGFARPLTENETKENEPGKYAYDETNINGVQE